MVWVEAGKTLEQDLRVGAVLTTYFPSFVSLVNPVICLQRRSRPACKTIDRSLSLTVDSPALTRLGRGGKRADFHMSWKEAGSLSGLQLTAMRRRSRWF